MSDKICPIYSTDQERPCIAEKCMLFQEGTNGGGCGLVRAPQQVVRRLDTLSAQVQEIQVVLNMQSQK